MTPTAVSQVLEQIANTIFSLVFAAYFIKYGIAARCSRWNHWYICRSTSCSNIYDLFL